MAIETPLTKWLMRLAGTAAGSGVPFVITATAKINILVIDLIIDKVLINSRQYVLIPYQYQAVPAAGSRM